MLLSLRLEEARYCIFAHSLSTFKISFSLSQGSVKTSDDSL